MSDSRLPNTPCSKPVHISSLLVSDQLVLLCSWAFFSPYLLRLLSFLFPLLATTSLLLLLTLLICSPAVAIPPPLPGPIAPKTFLDSAIQSVLDKLKFQSGREREESDGANRFFQELHMMLFEVSEIRIEKPMEEPKLEGFPDTLMSNVNDHPITVSQQHEMGTGPKSEYAGVVADSSKIEDQQMDKIAKAAAISPKGRSGWMEKEEWRKSLACKILEERQSSGDEGMDSLWEAYEAESKKKDSNMKKLLELEVKKKNNRRERGRKKSPKKYKKYGNGNEEDDEEDGFEEVCCLQALKGIGWLHTWGSDRP